jgi:hypothetical protein
MRHIPYSGNFLDFFPLRFYSFHCREFSPPYLSLLLDVFEPIINGIISAFFPILFVVGYGKAADFICLFCVLLLWNCFYEI